jgi:fused signal recognition particle receptor
MSWFQRLKEGLGRSSSKLVDSIKGAIRSGKLDNAALDEIEEALIASDLGPEAAGKIRDTLSRRVFYDLNEDSVRSAIADDIAGMLRHLQKPFAPDPARKPHVVLVIGVNGSGKTTTIGKLAHRLNTADPMRKIMLVAGDTFRAAAVSQLKIWGERTGAPVVSGPDGGDAASLAFDALTRARAEGVDVMLIDTAGRLHNKAHLMAELEKIIRVMRRVDPTAPHDVLLVLDATTGQNAIAQAETFKTLAGVSGVAVTKLDGSARGGILVALGEKFSLPVMAVGVGEGVDDLQDFDARAFAQGLLGLNS